MAKHHRDSNDIWANKTLHETGEEVTIDKPADLHSSTHSWTAADCKFFRIGYYNVTEWRGTICEPVSSLSPLLQEVADWDMSYADLSSNKHTKPNVSFNLFSLGEHIIATRGPGHLETASDGLGAFLLRLCNDNSREILKVRPQVSAFHVKCGSGQYESTPDGGIYIREHVKESDSMVFLILEDAKLPHPSGQCNKEYQVLGEMIAAAFFNYTNTDARESDQTVFAVRIMASSFTFYRIDVPADYLASLSAGRPAIELVVFRWGGTHDNEKLGIELGNNGNDRERIVYILASICAACAHIAKCTTDKKLPADITRDRLEELYPQTTKKAKQHAAAL